MARSPNCGRKPAAFEKLIDRLLALPQYGERWGRYWLDLARYADTAGDSADYPIPQAYKYRNYVIDAFNTDKPYDQFIREQIAGDLLPASSEQDRCEKIVATGYVATGLLALTLLVGPANLLLRRRNPISSYLRRDAGILHGVGRLFMPQLFLDRRDVACLRDNVFPHGMPGAMGRSALHVGEATCSVPDITDR